MAQNDQQLALLKNRLQLPLVVRDLMIADRYLSDDETYAMHEMLSNFSSEDALLCSALIMKEVAFHEKVNSQDAAFFHMECERIIERYSARDDLSNENPELWKSTQANVLYDTQEDLECFLDLISLCKLSYEVKTPHVAHVIDILDNQLQSHLLIIDEAINLRESESSAFSLPNGFDADNVLVFPVNQHSTH